MGNEFLNSSNGAEPAIFQHALWFLGHPEVWISFFLWATILIAIIKMTKRLWHLRKITHLISFLLITIVLLVFYIWLSKNAVPLYTEGRGNEVLLLSYAKRFLIAVSLLASIWIIRDLIKSKRSN